MSLERVDPDNDGLFRRWFDAYDAATVDRADPSARWTPPEWRARADATGAAVWWELYADDGDDAPRVVAALQRFRDARATTTRAELVVAADWRRAGYGTAALRSLESIARDHGYTQLVVMATDGPDEHGAHHVFATRSGYVIGDVQERRDIDVPLDDAFVRSLRSRWEPLASSYKLHSVVGVTPEPWLDARARLGEEIAADMPHEDLELDDEHWDRDVVRHRERSVAAMGRRLLLVYAVPIGHDEPVAFTELTVSESAPTYAYQWDTHVTRAARGHRLGGLMKLANLEALATTGLATRVVRTHNSATNTPMITVNDALGARVSERRYLWRRFL